jgi:hypothetical protein
VHKQVPYPPGALASLPPRLSSLIAACMQELPGQRPTAAAVVHGLEDARRALCAAAHSAQPPPALHQL